MKIVVVSYFAPPRLVVASHRVLRLSRLLLAHGHEVHWVTQDPDRVLARDQTLATMTPPRVTLHPFGGPTVYERPMARSVGEKVVRTLAYTLPRHFALPDGHFEWSWRLMRRLPALLREIDADVVLFCCGPHGQLLALPSVRRALPDIRIAVDYRDLLTGNTWQEASRSARVRAGLRRRERRLLALTDAVFINTTNARERFLSCVGEIDGVPVDVMRNTADYGLADEIEKQLPPIQLGEGTHIGFFGTVFPNRRLRTIITALSHLPAEQRNRVRLHCFCDSIDSPVLLGEDLATVPGAVVDRVTIHPLLSYGPALRTMQAMDALVLVNSAREEDAIFVPGKLYDYLMACRPVLFEGTQGDARSIIEKTSGADWCFEPGDVDGIAARIAGMIDTRPKDLEPDEEFSPERSFGPLLARLDEWAAADRRSS